MKMSHEFGFSYFISLVIQLIYFQIELIIAIDNVSINFYHITSTFYISHNYLIKGIDRFRRNSHNKKP